MFYKAKGPQGDIIEVTSKTYRVLYESKGYVLVDDEDVSEKGNIDDKKTYGDMSIK